jgi:hypothetical protein
MDGFFGRGDESKLLEDFNVLPEIEKRVINKHLTLLCKMAEGSENPDLTKVIELKNKFTSL